MKIDKDDLNRYIWWEDKNGNRIDVPYDYNLSDLPDDEYLTYHTIFPLDIVENVSEYTFHPQTTIQRMLWKIPILREYMKKKHKSEKTFQHICSFSDYIGGGNQDVIMAMVNSGDYTLSEALMLYSQCCARCMNVLAYKYGCGGYPEYSDEWKKCGTRCNFCKGED